MSDSLENSLQEDLAIDRICDAFEMGQKSGHQVSIEECLHQVPPPLQPRLLMELIAIEIDFRKHHGEPCDPLVYSKRFPQIEERLLVALFEKDAGLWESRRLQLQDDPTLPNGMVEDRTALPSRRLLRYFGDYCLQEKIATGGMGTVCLASQVSLNRRVAIKMIKSGRFASDIELKRFQAEAKAAASLFHPHIVPVYEVGEQEGEHFYSMAYIEGMSLSQRLVSGPLDHWQAVKLLVKVARAVQYAHEQGVIHRDLKPSNILLDRSEEPHVTDFGLARGLTDDTRLTMSGEILGTPSFMSPEQASGQNKAIGFASDVYSLGSILYNCLTGRPPFQAASHVATLKQVLENEPVAVRELNESVPRDLETIVHKCLEKSVGRRYPSCRELEADLQRFLEGKPIAARPVGPIERSWRWCRRHPAFAGNIAAALVILLGSLVGWRLVRAREEELASQREAESLVSQLEVANAVELPKILERVRKEPRAQPLLQDRLLDPQIDEEKQYRIALGRLGADPKVVATLCRGLLHQSWSELDRLRVELNSHRALVQVWLKEMSDQEVEALEPNERIRWEAIRAAFEGEPREGAISRKENLATIDHVTGPLLDELRSHPEQIAPAAKAIEPLIPMLGQAIATRFDRASIDKSDSGIAAHLLSAALKEDLPHLLHLGRNGVSEVLPILFQHIASDPRNLRFLEQQVEQSILIEDWDKRNEVCRVRAIAAALIFKLGDMEAVWPLLRFSENPSTRSLLIEWIPKFQRDPTNILQRFESLVQTRDAVAEKQKMEPSRAMVQGNRWLTEDNSSELRSLIQMLGHYPPSLVERGNGGSVLTIALDRLELDPDPGIRSSCEWLLLRHGRVEKIRRIDQGLQGQGFGGKDWCVDTNGHIMARLEGPIDFEAGAQPNDPDRDAGNPLDPYTLKRMPWSEDRLHPKRIPRTFAIALHETRLDQMHQMDPTFHELHNIELAGDKMHPACKVSWCKAAEYCNFLSKMAGLPEEEWCFQPDSLGNYSEGTTCSPDYLKRKGFRLPTEAEWEYACRAGTRTKRYFGDSDELLGKYAWYMRNSEERSLSLPGTLLPNDLGLFDTMGNVMEWCMDGYDRRQSDSRTRRVDLEDLRRTANRILKGGSILEIAREVRASEYSNFQPTYREVNCGFRVARTLQSHQIDELEEK